MGSGVGSRAGSGVRRRRLPAAAAAAVLALGVAGCAANPQDDAVAWTGRLCDATRSFLEAARTTPAATADPVAQARELRRHLDTTLTALDATASGLGQLGPSPVDGGDDAVTGSGDRLRQYREAFRSARAAVDALGTSDVDAVRDGLPAALAPLDQLRLPTGDDLWGTPELSAAADRAPACGRLGQDAQGEPGG
jgi:hypothetical protein